MVKHWLPEGYKFLSNLILPFVVGAEELWRAHKNARGAREEGEDTCVFPHTRAAGFECVEIRVLLYSECVF